MRRRDKSTCCVLVLIVLAFNSDTTTLRFNTEPRFDFSVKLHVAWLTLLSSSSSNVTTKMLIFLNEMRMLTAIAFLFRLC